MLSEVASRITQEPEFKRELLALMRTHLLHEVNPESTSDPIPDQVLIRLLECALTLSGSDQPRHRRVAYRIATCLLRSPLSRFDNLRDVVSLTLARLGNFPADDFLARQVGPPEYTEVPKTMFAEMGLHRQRNTVTLPGDRPLVLTDFQVMAWTAAATEQAVAVTAPTSAGKSFALQQFICAEVIRQPDKHHLILVPTRSLIGQVSASIGSILAAYQPLSAGVVVSTVPLQPQELDAQQVVYVLTQERLQILLERIDPASFGVIAVDEAQLVGHGSRGIILQSVLENLWAAGARKVLLSAPSATDIGVYQEILEMERLTALRATDPAVAQNLVFLNVSASGDRVACSALVEDEPFELGTVPALVQLVDERQMFAALSYQFGRGGSSLVYAGGQAACEKIALLIRDSVLAFEPNRTVSTDHQTEIDDFVKLLKTHIHSEYPLIPAVQAGVGFHYGNMPTIVRLGVEQLFAAGVIRFLVCTSTLLHGVNFPAKNLFMYKPTKGEDTPLSASEFWNLAGRAGRLGKELEGNVYLINRDSWSVDPVVQPTIARADWPVLETLRSSAPEVLAVVSGEVVRTDADIEATAFKLYAEHQQERLPRLRERIDRDVSPNFTATLEAALEEAATTVRIPMEQLAHHSTIYPLKQQAMLDYLVAKIREDDVDGVIPLHPSQSSQAVYTSLLRLFKRIHNTFEGLPRDNESHKFFAVIARDWMRGYPLNRLITEQLKRRGPRATAPPAIRDVLETVEQDLRFRYVKFTRCYNDLLTMALTEEDLTEHIPRIPALPLYLELGACSGTMVSLIGLGLSRTTAALLADQAINKAMNRSECIRWLSRNTAVKLSLPLVCRREVDAVAP